MEEDAGRPFDAGVILMREAPGSSPTTWSTVSLVRYARVSLLTPPSERAEPAGTRARLVECVATLSERGLDGHGFLRYGLGVRLSEFIAALTTLPRLLEIIATLAGTEAIAAPHEASLVEAKDLPREIHEWSELCPIGRFEGHGKDFLEKMMEATHEWAARVGSWIRLASIDDLIDWRCPSQSEFDEVDESTHGLDGDIEKQYRWISDRLAETYLADWELESLLCEYRWLHGDAPYSFRDEITSLRRIPPDAVNAEIAGRVALNKADSGDRETAELLAIQALQLLKAGHRRSATATFRIIVKLSPEDASARNNLGFSLIPDDPRAAMRYLSVAARMSYDQPAINACNKMLCSLLLRSPKEALAIAEAVWEGIELSGPVPGYLWRNENESWTIRMFPDTRVQIARMAIEAARASGDDIESWHSRLKQLEADSSADGQAS
ncbi:hypothetical protein [Streptacidiphilus albus]|uniref:hypothetical protein n=1 Tax=Streptacidiphilus albus TaxID=105425 RepID=UPI00128E534A|nr:hypothetical protein [Streptacidiphilus albus]